MNATINFLEAQRTDPSLAKLHDHKARGKPKRPLSEWRHDPWLRALHRNYDRIFLHDGLLVRSLGYRQPHPNFVILIPPPLVDKVSQGTHDNPFCGHLGVTRTEERIRQRFYWPGIRTTVENYIKKCPTCDQRKTPSQPNRAPLRSI